LCRLDTRTTRGGVLGIISATLRSCPDPTPVGRYKAPARFEAMPR
jgi:hypothetical protein